jgi:nitrogen-specific signal transduction histidine kinase
MKPADDIIQVLPVAVLVFDAQGRFCSANRSACQLFKLDAQQAQGTMYHLLLPELKTINYAPTLDPPVAEAPEKPLAHLQDGRIVLTRSGQKLFCRSLALSGSNSHEERVVLLVEDMLDNRTLAGRILEEERLMGVTEISNTMAHKLNQYLQVIMGYISLMTLELDPANQCYGYLNKILDQLENIRITTYMLSNIHRYAIIERPDGRRMFDLDLAAKEAASLNFK